VSWQENEPGLVLLLPHEWTSGVSERIGNEHNSVCSGTLGVAGDDRSNPAKEDGERDDEED
jgi:hypothetical protein